MPWLRWSMPCEDLLEDTASFSRHRESAKEKIQRRCAGLVVGNRLMEKIDDNMRAIKKEDTRLVYLDPSSKGYLQNDTLTPPNSEMFRKKSCTSKNSAKTNCQFFMALCSYFGLGQETVKECKRYKSTGICRRMKTCKKTYFTTTCYRKPQGLKTN